MRWPIEARAEATRRAVTKVSACACWFVDGGRNSGPHHPHHPYLPGEAAYLAIAANA